MYDFNEQNTSDNMYIYNILHSYKVINMNIRIYF